MGLLGDRIRAKRVLALAAKEAGWGKALPKGHARGVAVHTSFDTVVAEVAEVTLASDGTPRVTHVTAAVDCGLAVNPELVRAQVEGAIAFGLSAALFGEVNFADGGVVEGNFDEYRVLRIDEMPRVDVHIVPSVEHPTGIGEPGLPPLAPAVANALAVLTGTRIRTLPFSKEKLVPI
jgi:isoquinoline 1-oxidoreductase beta subunit